MLQRKWFRGNETKEGKAIKCQASGRFVLGIPHQADPGKKEYCAQQAEDDDRFNAAVGAIAVHEIHSSNDESHHTQQGKQKTYEAFFHIQFLEKHYNLHAPRPLPTRTGKQLRPGIHVTLYGRYITLMFF